MTDLPSGTVTFLFTDLEGSTRLWEEHPDAMHDALARHDELVREAIETHHGHVVKTSGDGFHAAFATARDALDAALTAQLALTAEPWSATGPLRSRMGIHTGEAQHRAGDYYGTSLNRAARIMSVANGGQTLLSRASAEIVQDAVPDGCVLSDLGEHRLRDLSRVERVFQITAPGLSTQFPPLRTVDAFPGNLPLQTTSFVGREDEIAALVDALKGWRLVTVTGVGGVGKTRIALQAAADVLPEFPDGAWLCELASARDPDSMLELIATTLGVAPRHDLALDAAIVESLRSRSLLLVMDNCEHLLDAAGRLVDAILRSCVDVRVLATSREGLAVAGEHVAPLRSLPVPEPNASPDIVASCEAVRLFVQRADAARSGFAIDAANANAVAEICRRLDGVPLAIELAAARSGAMTPSEIARLLDERFRLLTGGRRTAVERHQTLRATVEWSYSLLDEREQKVFDRLGVFVGGFNVSAASAVAGAGGVEAWDVLDALDGLVAKSMVQADETDDGTMRFSTLDTLRAYAQEQLDAAGDADQWRRRHAGHYASVAEEVSEGMLGLAPRPAFVQYRSEIDNTRAAVDWALDSENVKDAEFAVRIVAALGTRAVIYAPWADRVLDRAPQLQAPQRASLLLASAYAAFERGDQDAAAGLAREAIDIGLANAWDLSSAHIRLARIDALRGRTDAAFATIADARAALARLAPDPGAEAMLGMATAQILAFTGDATAARTADEVLQRARASGQYFALIATLGIVAEINALEDPGTAALAAEESVALQRMQGETVFYGRVLALATLLRVRKGDSSGALTALREAISFHAERGNWSAAYSGMAIAVLTLDSLGELHAAAAIAACVAAGPMAPQRMIPLHEQHAERDVLRRIRTTIGAGEYDALFADAADLSSDLAVARALAVIDDLIATRG